MAEPSSNSRGMPTANVWQEHRPYPGVPNIFPEQKQEPNSGMPTGLIIVPSEQKEEVDWGMGEEMNVTIQSIADDMVSLFKDRGALLHEACAITSALLLNKLSAEEVFDMSNVRAVTVEASEGTNRFAKSMSGHRFLHSSAPWLRTDLSGGLWFCHEGRRDVELFPRDKAQLPSEPALRTQVAWLFVGFGVLWHQWRLRHRKLDDPWAFDERHVPHMCWAAKGT